MDRRVLFVISITGLSLMGCCCCGPINLPQAAPVRPVDNPNVAKKDRKRPGAKDLNVFAKGKVILDQAATLGAGDPLDPIADQQNIRMKVHEVQMQPGKTYVVTMNSAEFDSYLRIESPNGEQLVEDDDSGGALNAKIVFAPNQPGAHRVIATSFNGGLGRYQLKVQELN